MIAKHLENAKEITALKDRKLRFTTPAAVCSYCTGETRIGEPYQLGTLRFKGKANSARTYSTNC